MAKLVGLSTIEILIACGILALVCTISVSSTQVLRHKQDYLQHYAAERNFCLNRYELQQSDLSQPLTKNISLETIHTSTLSLEYLKAN
jgi:hypothetical protein